MSFKLEQSKLEEKERIAENVRIAEIESNRRFRILENQLKQQQLNTSILRRKFNETEEPEEAIRPEEDVTKPTSPHTS